MKMKLKKYTSTEVEVEVTFPLYGEYDYGEHESQWVYWKVGQEADGTLTEIKIREYESWSELEIRKNYTLKADECALGLGVYESSEESFLEALNKIKAYLP